VHDVSTRILIAGNHRVNRRLSRARLETRAAWRVCGQAENGQEVVTALLKKTSMYEVADRSGFDRTREAYEKHPYAARAC
jgi:hypothetical protein